MRDVFIYLLISSLVVCLLGVGHEVDVQKAKIRSLEQMLNDPHHCVSICNDIWEDYAC